MLPAVRSLTSRLPPNGPGGRDACTPATVTPGWPTAGASGATAMTPMNGASGTWTPSAKNATSRPPASPVRMKCRAAGMSNGSSSGAVPG